MVIPFRVIGSPRLSIPDICHQIESTAYDVLADGIVAGTLAYGQHEDRTPTHGYEATREAAMAAFAKSWRRE